MDVNNYWVSDYVTLQIYPGGLKWKPYEPTAKERRQAAQIQKNQDDRQQKKR